NTANVWSIPKPPVTNYTALVQIQCDAAAFQAKGGQGYTDMEVAYHFPICVKADGTTNHEYIKMFRYFLVEQSKWNLAEMARPKDPDVHKEMARPVGREPIDDGRALQYQIMIKEGRTIPPIPTQFELSQDFLDIGDGRYRSMSVEGVRFHLVQAQVEYLLNDTPDKALEGLRFLKADISDEQASFLLRTPTDQLVPATAYAEYVLPKK